MKPPDVTLKIIDGNQCPLYVKGDVFSVKGRALIPPSGKATCMTLPENIAAAVRDCEQADGDCTFSQLAFRFNCSGAATGCEGVIRMECRIIREVPDFPIADDDKAGIRRGIHLLAGYPVFKELATGRLEQLTHLLTSRQAESGETIIRKGDAGHRIYIVATGRAVVEGEGGVTLNTIEPGEVFGEMSLLSGEPAGATVTIDETGKLLCMAAEDFRRLLEECPSVERYLSPLVAKRLAITVLSRFPIFQELDKVQLQRLGNFLSYKRFDAGEVILEKGAPGVDLYIISTGRAEVAGNDVRIAVLDRGEVFGEMSLISGEPVSATVRALTPCKLLYIKGREFLQILAQYPPMQRYLTHLLTKRLAETNNTLFQDFSYGMTGKLADISPAELFQALNVNQKTGALNLSLPGGAARVCFRDGEMVRAAYGDRDGTAAFFQILKEKTGRFKFSSELSPEEKASPFLGDFMWLLMEGVRKIDEASDRG